ncbi:MAG: RNA 2',3'-cyclic phosphodiesterase [Ahrensia sp.]|nr:RNA 2',3'-cyclic phosphodiesterase [Ahrensia sp.]
MPRLFTAIPLSHQTIMHLSLLRGGLPGASFIDPENYHLTLRFIGDIDNHTADELALALERVKCSPFILKIDSLDVFGGNKPRALFARIAPSPALSKLQDDIERICQRLYLPADGRKFTPHVPSRAFTIYQQRRLRGILPTMGVSTSHHLPSRNSDCCHREIPLAAGLITEETYVFDRLSDVDMNQPTATT